MASPERIDIHAHFAVTPPAFAEKYGDQRWPHLEVGKDTAVLYRDGQVVRTLPPSAWSIDDRLAELDSADLARQVLSPVPPLMCDWAEERAAADWARHLNHGLADLVDAYPQRFDALGTVPLNHPRSAVEVLEEAHTMGLVGVQIGASANGRDLDRADLTEFFQAAGELGMLVFLHPLALGAQADWTSRIDTLEITFGVGLTTDTAIAASRLVFNGTLAASPGLTLCLAHGGGSFAWVLTRIAHLWDRTHDRKAADLARDVYVDSVVFDRANLRYLVDRLGADRVLFGTDHPLPGCDSLTGATLHDLNEEDRGLVEGGNLRRILRSSGRR